MQHPNLQKSLVIPTVTAGVAEKCGKQEEIDFLVKYSYVFTLVYHEGLTKVQFNLTAQHHKLYKKNYDF